MTQACRHSTPHAARCYLLAAALCLFSLPGLTQSTEFREIPEPDIISRSAWGAQPANAELMQEQKPLEVVIHHTGERQQPKLSIEVKMRGLQGYSFKPARIGLISKPAWGDVPYHYYIDFQGKIAEGRDISFAGDSITPYDSNEGIQIALEGDFEREEPAKAQLASLKALVAWLAQRFAIAPENITGHSDHAQTNCPGKNLKPYFEEIRRAAGGE